MSYVFLASVDESANRPSLLYKAGSRRWLISFFHMSSKRPKFMQEAPVLYPGTSVLVDSGAFTFLNTMREWADQQIQDYLDNYLTFLHRFKENIFAAVELDLCELLGYSKIREWEEEHFKPLEYGGLPIIYVWHPNRLESGWEDMCRRHHYVGITGVENAQAEVRLHAFLNVAQRYCCKVHGFGFTKTSLWRLLPFFSADSSTWTGGERYGMTQVYDGTGIQQLRDKSVRRSLKPICDIVGASFDDLLADKPEAVNAVNAYSYLQFEEKILRLHHTEAADAVFKARLPYVAVAENMTDTEMEPWAGVIAKLGFENLDIFTADGRIIFLLLCAIGNCEQETLARFDRGNVDDVFRLLGVDHLRAAQDALYAKIRPRRAVAAQRNLITGCKPTRPIQDRPGVQLGDTFGAQS